MLHLTGNEQYNHTRNIDPHFYRTTSRSVFYKLVFRFKIRWLPSFGLAIRLLEFHKKNFSE